MEYVQLVDKILQSVPFESGDEAQLALMSSLNVLGYALPERLVRGMQTSLPSECGPALDHGLALSRERGHWGPAPAALNGEALERVQEICRVLARAFEPALVEQIARALPAPLAIAFAAESDPATARATPKVAASGKRSLSEAAPGSSEPLSSGRPRSAQPESVAASNPHGDSKLSSARGLTQEREGNTLAAGKRRGGRPLIMN